MNHKHVVLKNETIEQLHKIRHMGQSYDGVIRELIADKKPLLQES